MEDFDSRWKYHASDTWKGKAWKKVRQFSDYCKFDTLLSRIVANCCVALSLFVALHCRNLSRRIAAIRCVALSQTVVSHCRNLSRRIVAIRCVALSQFVALQCRKLLWCRIVAIRCVALSQFVVSHCRIMMCHVDALLCCIIYIHYYANTVRYVRLSDVAMQDIWDRAGGPVFTQGPVRFRK